MADVRKVHDAATTDGNECECDLCHALRGAVYNTGISQEAIAGLLQPLPSQVQETMDRGEDRQQEPALTTSRVPPLRPGGKIFVTKPMGPLLVAIHHFITEVEMSQGPCHVSVLVVPPGQDEFRFTGGRTEVLAHHLADNLPGIVPLEDDDVENEPCDRCERRAQTAGYEAMLWALRNVNYLNSLDAANPDPAVDDQSVDKPIAVGKPTG